VAAALAAAGALAACGFAVAAHAPGSVALAAATLAFAIWTSTRWLLGRGRRSVVGFTWSRHDTWRLKPVVGRRFAARLVSASMLFPSWTLLAWADAGGRRYYVLLDAAVAGRREYATLRSRLRLERLRASV
jgi:hypothetical protein